MPYRRLPNTDTARFKAIETAVNKSFHLHPFELPFTQNTLLQLKSFLPIYRQSISLLKENSDKQKEISENHHENARKLKLYVSHFIQVLNFAILRGEIKEKARTYFGVSEDAKNLPSLKTEAELRLWSEKLIDGEDRRIMEGGVAMTNPRIALMKIRYEEYMKSGHSFKIAQKSTKAAQEKIASLRNQADELILLLWNEIEGHFSDNTPDEKRRSASEYGVKYVYRPHER